MSDGGLFRTFQRDHRPLSQRLDELCLRPSVALVRLYDAELDRPTGDLVDELVAGVKRDGPAILGLEVASSRPVDGDWRPIDHGTRVGTNRHYVAVGISGDIELLERWPDLSTAPLTPINDFGDDSHWEPQDPSNPFDAEAARESHRRQQANKLWELGTRDFNEGQWALYTFVDLTDAEELAVEAGELDVRAMVDANLAAVAPIIEAIRVQTEQYFAEELPTKLASAIEDRRSRVKARKAVREALDWGKGWRFETPKLEDPPPVVDTAADVASALLEVDHSRRLSPASFSDVQRTMRVWVDAVEHYPAAYLDLHEDRLSDLLAATLNASLPGAAREVYSRGGKSDIYIRADALSTGARPVTVFIAESKWWGGASKARAAQRQLLRYVQVRNTSAVLLFFIDKSKPERHRTKAIECLRDMPGFTGEREGAVEDWPILTYVDDDRAVDVCVASVFLPPLVVDDLEKAKRQRRTLVAVNADEADA